MQISIVRIKIQQVDEFRDAYRVADNLGVMSKVAKTLRTLGGLARVISSDRHSLTDKNRRSFDGDSDNFLRTFVTLIFTSFDDIVIRADCECPLNAIVCCAVFCVSNNLHLSLDKNNQSEYALLKFLQRIADKYSQRCYSFSYMGCT